MARTFDGTNDSLSAAAVDLSAVDKITVSAWVYAASYPGEDNFALDNGSDAGGSDAGWALDPNWYQGDAAIYLGPAAYRFARPAAGAWHHVAFNIDRAAAAGSQAAVWVDAAAQSLTSIGSVSGNFAAAALNFGYRAATGKYFAGRLAEVAVWPGLLLTAVEVANLCRGQCPLAVRPSARPYYWPLRGYVSPEPEASYGATAALADAPGQADHPTPRPITSFRRPHLRAG